MPKRIDYARLGAIIRAFRTKLNLSAEALGLSEEALANIETGATKLDLDDLIRICNAFQLPTQALIDEALTEEPS